MSAFYSNMANTASKLLSKFGFACVFAREGNPVYNPSTSELQTTSESYTANSAVFDFESKDIDESNILSTDLKILVEAKNDFEPQEGDSFLYNGKSYLIVKSGVTAPAGQAVIYTCQARLGGKNNGFR